MICLIYTPTSSGLQSSGLGVHIRQITRAHDTTITRNWKKKTNLDQDITAKLQFSHIHSHRSWCFIRRTPNLQWKCPITRAYIPSLKLIMPAISEMQETKVSVFFSSFFSFLFFFLHKHKNHSNLRMHVLIMLKFSTSEGQIKANISTKFGDNPTNLCSLSNNSRK